MAIQFSRTDWESFTKLREDQVDVFVYGSSASRLVDEPEAMISEALVGYGLEELGLNAGAAEYVVEEPKPDGVTVNLAVPFRGSEQVTRYRPSEFTANPPDFEIFQGKVHFRRAFATGTGSDAIRSWGDTEIAKTAKWFEWANRSIALHNQNIEHRMRAAIAERLAAIEAQKRLAAELGGVAEE